MYKSFSLNSRMKNINLNMDITWDPHAKKQGHNLNFGCHFI